MMWCVCGKRELIARGLFWSGATFLLSKLPKRDLLLVLNYHRIGEPDGRFFYPTIVSATAEELDGQVRCLKQYASLITRDKALAFPEGKQHDATPRCPLLILELAHATRGEAPPLTQRRFLYWDEARDMIRGNMAIGSHTHPHHVLSQLTPAGQRQELAQSRAILDEQLGVPVVTVAYPRDNRQAFTDDAQQAAQEAGYRAAFSSHGGVSLPGGTCRYDVKRNRVEDRSLTRFRVEAAMWRSTGRFWP